MNQSLQQPVRKSYEVEAKYPGFGRLAYFLINLVMTVLLYGLFFFVLFAAFGIGNGTVKGAVAIFGLFILLMMFVNLFIAYKRVVNLGMPGWSLLLIFVPFINIWLGWRLIACPAGYEHHRTLDQAGKIITGLILGFFGLSILMGILSAFLAA